ncbi:MAG: hypothetical protein KF781_09235 [Chitinophagaceae bacterium]|nr:hypothetical protein [Chitinophagaceae bacterium]
MDVHFLKTMSFVKVIETNGKKSIPNKETIKAMQEVKSRKVNSYKNAKDLFKKLDS